MTTFIARIKDLQVRPNNQKEYLEFLDKNDSKDVSITFERLTGVRTRKQNDALHLYFQHLAQELNEKGLDMKKVLKQEVDIEWTTDNIKTYIWKPMQEAITGKKSTTQLDKTSEITNIWEHLNWHFSSKYGVHVPFPTEKKDETKIDYPQESNETKF